MALNKQVLQSLNSPRLRPLNMRGLAGLTAGQLRKMVEVEKAEIGQLRNQLNTEMAEVLTSGESSMGVGLSAIELPESLSERQTLVRELQQLRKEKMEIVEQIKALRANPNAAADLLKKSLKEVERIKKEIDKRKKKEEKERQKKEKEEERKKKQEEKKDKLWNQKNLRRGSVGGERAHDRFKRYFDSKKIDEADKDRMRKMLEDVSFYESDEIFQILSLMESKAFDSIDEAEEFLIDFYHIQRGQTAALEKFRGNKEGTNSEAAEENIENMAQDFEVNTGLGLRF